MGRCRGFAAGFRGRRGGWWEEGGDKGASAWAGRGGIDMEPPGAPSPVPPPPRSLPSTTRPEIHHDVRIPRFHPLIQGRRAENHRHISPLPVSTPGTGCIINGSTAFAYAAMYECVYDLCSGSFALGVRGSARQFQPTLFSRKSVCDLSRGCLFLLKQSSKILAGEMDNTSVLGNFNFK